MKCIEMKIDARRYGLAGAALLLLGLTALPALAQARPERSLAGITIGRPVSQVLNRYGTPSRVELGSRETKIEVTKLLGIGTEASIKFPRAFVYDPDSHKSLSDYLKQSNRDNQPVLPEAGGAPDAFIRDSKVNRVMQDMVLQEPNPSPNITPTPPVINRQVNNARYHYDYPDGSSLRFTIGSTGLIEQIDVSAPWRFKLSKTMRGIYTGSTYESVILKYGYPDYHMMNPDGSFMLDYAGRYNVAFTILGNRVKSVTVVIGS